MKIGTKVKMVNCYEAEKCAGVIWETRSEPWALGNGTMVVALKGRGGGFSMACLETIE